MQTVQTVQTTQDRLPLEGADAAPEWRLDEHTREVGRRGLAEARAALTAAARRVAAREVERARQDAA
jgi:hypothetical protein